MVNEEQYIQTGIEKLNLTTDSKVCRNVIYYCFYIQQPNVIYSQSAYAGERIKLDIIALDFFGHNTSAFIGISSVRMTTSELLETELFISYRIPLPLTSNPLFCPSMPAMA